jgi:Asp-tRNA(Asn)/Glu-tRNA(Gln) amidotransferase A subunit family amidase
MDPYPDARTLTTALQRGETTAIAIVETTLATIAQRDSTLNCFTTVTAERA